MSHLNKVNIWFSCLFVFLILSFPLVSSAELSQPEQQCFGISMVGYDSVINSRLGVPAEHALDLAMIRHANNSDKNAYAPFLLKVILDAYLWGDTPHTYAVKVLFKCAQRQSMMQTVYNDDQIQEMLK